MKSPKIDRLKLLRFAASFTAILLALALLVLIPLKTHRSPVPDPKYSERSADPTPVPTPVPTPAQTLFPDPNDPDRNEELQALLDAFIEEHPGTWDLYVYNLSYGEYAASSTQEGEPLISASLIKLYIMGAVFQQFKDGKLQYWDCFPSVRQMIVVSDNFCANWLILRLGESQEQVGFDTVNAFAASIGCTSTSLNRSMLDTKSEKENYTSAEDLALLFKKLYRFELVSPEYSRDMLEILKAQYTKDRIPAGIPKDVVCAHKTGDLANKSCGDAGIVFSPAADYILVIINNNSENDSETVQQIAELSAQVYDFLNPPVEEEEEDSLSEG